MGEVRGLVEGATEVKQRELARLIHAIYRPYVARWIAFYLSVSLHSRVLKKVFMRFTNLNWCN